MSGLRLAPGARVGPYEVVALIGKGGMGEVYRARDTRLSRDVALKVLPADIASDEQLRRFEHEAKAAGALNHPNIVAVYDTGENAGSPYIVSELLDGETLGDRLAIGPLGSRKARDYGAQIARGLAAAHDRGIVHRDLKPDNVFVTRDGLVKILDFGIAKLGEPPDQPTGTDAETRSNTTPGTLLGTVGYMSPEQARGLSADHRSDIFSLGALLFEMLTGRRAFKRATTADTLSAILREDPTADVTEGPDLPPAFLRVVRRCLEKALEDRFQSARDLAFALDGALTESRTDGAEPGSKLRRRWARGLVLLAVLALLGFGLWRSGPLGFHFGPPRPPPHFQRLTFRLGATHAARFASDGETVVFSAQWGGQPSEVFSTRASSRGSRPLGVTNAELLAVSSQGEMALLLRPRLVTWDLRQGTLARAPVAGGAPRELLDDVLAADWSPDGRDLAVVHVVDSGIQLEFPQGQVLHAPPAPHWISQVRVSPRGDRIAFVEHSVERDTHGDLRTVDRQGRVTTLAAGYSSFGGLVWAPDGSEILLGGSREGGAAQQVLAVTLSGRERVVMSIAGGMSLLDVSRQGDALIARSTAWNEVRARGRGASEEAELPGADLSSLSDLTPDGTRILGTDVGDGSGPNYSFYVQATDGSAPVWLGEGDGQALSPDGQLALALLRNSSPQQLRVVPTGAGETRVLEPGPVVQYQRAVWDPTGRKVVFSAAERKGGELRLYVQSASSGPPLAVGPPGVGLLPVGRPVSPDGARVVAAGPEGVPALYPLTSGEPAATVPGLVELDVPLCFTPDGRELLVARYGETALPVIEKIDIASGHSRPWKGLPRTPPSAVLGDYRVLVAPDGASYAYSYFREMRDLYLVTGFR